MLNFGNISALQYCTCNFSGSDPLTFTMHPISPEGPNLEKNISLERLKTSSETLEIFNIDLENFNLDLENSPQNIGVWWVARLKFSSSLENITRPISLETFNLGLKSWIFLQDLGPLGK